MKRISSIVAINVLWLTGFCVYAGMSSRVRAQGIGGQVRAQPFKNRGQIEPSGVEPIGSGKYLLVADDEAAALLIVDVEQAMIRKDLEIPGLAVKKPDWEAMAKDSQNNYYLIASTGTLVRFKLKNEAELDFTKIEIGPETVAYLSLEKSSDLNIEGLAVWISDKGKEELVIGVREENSETIHSYRAEFSGDKKLRLRPFFKFDVPKTQTEIAWHLSSIEYVRDWKGFLILTSNEKDDKTFYGNILWFVSNEALTTNDPPKVTEPRATSCNFRDVTTAVKILDLFEQGSKAEGLAVLRRVNDATFRVVIVFDNDYPATNRAAALAFLDITKKDALTIPVRHRNDDSYQRKRRKGSRVVRRSL